MRPSVLALLVLTGACGGSPPPRAKASPARLEDVAMSGVEEQLRELGYPLRGGGWSFSLALESEETDRGPKVQVRLSVFREPGHTLRGELAPWAISTGDVLSTSSRRALARDLGKRAAKQFAERFASP